MQSTMTQYQYNQLQSILKKPCKRRKTGQVASIWTDETWLYVISIGHDDFITVEIIKTDRMEVIKA